MSAPQQIGKYRLLDRIGEGAMGEVFRAHDPILDRQIALKVISAGDEDRRQRFRREAQSAARLTHPNIVVVHDFGEDSGRFFMAMELLPGSDFKRAIAAGAFPDVSSKLQVMEQVCDAVAYAHSMSIVHRDLKPANIFLLPNGQVKILDFGLARVGHSEMTGTGTILGTPNYMAPEQIRGARIDSRADIFSLGAVFYELFSGQKAFPGESLHTVLYKVMQDDPPPLRGLSAIIPLAVSDMVKKALAKDPTLRFQSLAEMRDAVRAVRDRGPDGANVSLSELMREHRSDTVIVDRKTADAVRSMVWPDDRAGRSTSSVPSGPSLSVDAPPSRVTFAGESGGDVIVEVPRGQTLLAASLAAGIPHMHECGGNARCSTCRVLVLGSPENLPPRDSAELKLAKRLGFGDDIRLACQTKPRGPVRVRRLILDQDDIQLTRVDRTPMAGNETPLGVLYAGIREFPQFTKRALPYDAVHVLNRYYLQIGEAVLANGGHIDKYLTGGVLALFGIGGEEAKVKCTNALRAALRMQRRMEPLNAYLGQHFGVTFTLEAGLHYGRMIVGHMGHPDHQRLTAIGEPAALATAVAVANQHHGSTILATEEIVNIVESDIATGQPMHELLGGRDREYTLYEVLDFAKPDTHYIVQSSFERVAQRREEAAGIFYKHLFDIAPQTRPMFEGVDMATQGSMLMNMIAAAVRGLDRLDELKPVLEDLGRRHARYGVRVEHFSPVEECLLHTVKTMMGEEFNLDVQLAWTQIYNFVAQTMIEAAASA
ncbi:MAG TPA: protein kinase [Thermoanaerobaculia bacterium]|nr:protein kinase [Thermoanaerobaculia bacterium]